MKPIFFELGFVLLVLAIVAAISGLVWCADAMGWL